LTKSDGSSTRPLRIGKRVLRWHGHEIDVVAAPSFARQGLAGSLMRAYGEACRNVAFGGANTPDPVWNRAER
jgi:hypothetical protein